MTKVMIYSIRRDRVKFRLFKTEDAANRFAYLLKQQLLNCDMATVFIDVLPA